MKKILNQKVFLELVNGDAATFLPIIEDYQANGEQLLLLITKGKKNGSLEEVHYAAHQLKGSSGMLGLERMYELCKEVESFAIDELSESLLEDLAFVFKEGVSQALTLLKS